MHEPRAGPIRRLIRIGVEAWACVRASETRDLAVMRLPAIAVQCFMLELPEEAHVVFVESADVFDVVAAHAEAFDAEAEGEA